ncbi:desulfoferrodoxin family protein [Lachnoclostridium sp. Marseille-P6806]|uniref:desulfoferrodoxin family protein n=1 Tax=Lachnoclostridium sp. Marseille-P6806 TaxID=2364793 RepID=UPI0010305696|nr:desulfoferrodoxin family protein [Lachnoclostridium sp. Marseille-P6806]
MKFYKCSKCGKVIEMVMETGVPTICCGEAMSELIPGTTDAALEKHVPVVAVDGNRITVNVGEVTHPMLDEHFIAFIALETEKGVQRVDLKPGQAPEAVFAVADGDKAVAAYEYCNLHGLWKKDI